MAKFLPAFVAFAALAGAETARAQDARDDGRDEGWTGFVAVGAAVLPKYEGADTYEASPFIMGDFRRGGVKIELRGLEARADLLPSDTWAAGPILSLRGGRDATTVGATRLSKLDMAVEAGGFVGVRLGGDETGRGRWTVDLSLTTDVSGTHDGTLAGLSVGYGLVRTETWFVNIDAQASFADRKFLRFNYGVPGLAGYAPKSSVRDISVGTTVGYALSPKWSLIGRASYGQLVGDAVDGPVTKLGGKNQGLLAIAAAYRF